MVSEVVDNYMINQKTIAILPADGSDGSLESIVLEEDRQIRCKKRPLEIVRESCVYFGSTYNGRKKSARSMGFKSMPPVCISSDLGIFLIALMSETHRGCTWIAHTHVINWTEADKQTALIEFSNQQVLSVKGNASSLGRKVMRAAQYRLTLSKRIATSQTPMYPIGVRETGKSQPVKINARGTYTVGA